jgi:hypothetical protein
MTDMLAIAARLAEAQEGGVPPVENWHPTHCGEMDLVIRRDGAWVHEGTPIGRPELVRLFSRVLRKDDDGYVLVTPVEKIAIQVEDVPFLIIGVERKSHGQLQVRSNVGDVITIDEDHPLTVRTDSLGQDVPYVRVRGELDARFSRAAYYHLVDMAETVGDRLRISSGPCVFDLGAIEA